MSLTDAARDHWYWLLTPAGTLASWLARRRIGSAWRTLWGVVDANKRLANCETERDDAIRAREYLRVALDEITAAAAHVKTAHDAALRRGRTPSADSPTAPAGSPATSTKSPRRRSGGSRP